MRYLAGESITKKWSRNYPGWDLVINQLNIVFSEVLHENHNKKEP